MLPSWPAEFKVGQSLRGELDVLRDDDGTDVMIVRFRPVGEAQS